MHSLLKSPFRLSLNFSYSHCWCYVKQFAYVTLFSCLKIALRCISPPIFILVDKQGIVNAVLRCSPTLVFPGSSLDTQKGGLCWENQMRYAPGCILCNMSFVSFALHITNRGYDTLTELRLVQLFFFISPSLGCHIFANHNHRGPKNVHI